MMDNKNFSSSESAVRYHFFDSSDDSVSPKENLQVGDVESQGCVTVSRGAVDDSQGRSAVFYQSGYKLVGLGSVATLTPGQRAYLWIGSVEDILTCCEKKRSEALAPYTVWTNLPSPPCGNFGYEHPSGYCWGGSYEDWLTLAEQSELLSSCDGEIFGFLVLTRHLSGEEESHLLDLWDSCKVTALCLVDKRDSAYGDDYLEGDRGLRFLENFYDSLEEERILCFAPTDVQYLPLGQFLSFHPVSNTIIWSNYGGE